MDFPCKSITSRKVYDYTPIMFPPCTQPAELFIPNAHLELRLGTQILAYIKVHITPPPLRNADDESFSRRKNKMKKGAVTNCPTLLEVESFLYFFVRTIFLYVFCW